MMVNYTLLKQQHLKPKPYLVEVLPVHFYNKQDETLEGLRCKPEWMVMYTWYGEKNTSGE
jgi:hypothetical protein